MRAKAIGLTLVAVTCWVFWCALSHGFVYEDLVWSYQPIHWSLTPGQWWISALWSPDPFWVHLLNLSVHLLNAWMLYHLSIWRGWGRWAWWTTGIFLLHPIQIEAVAYGSGRSELLVTSGLLAVALLLHSPTFLRSLLAVVCAWLTMGVKQTGVVVVGIAALVLLWERRRVWIVAVLAPLALLGVPELVWRNQSAVVGWADWWSWEAANVWTLLWLVVWPAGLSVEHDPMTLGPMWLLLGFVVLAACGAVLLWAPIVKGRAPLPAWSFGLYWAGIVLLPRFALIMPSAPLTEHHFYGVMAGLSLSLAGVLGNSSLTGLDTGCAIGARRHRPLSECLTSSAGRSDALHGGTPMTGVDSNHYSGFRPVKQVRRVSIHAAASRGSLA